MTHASEEFKVEIKELKKTLSPKFEIIQQDEPALDTPRKMFEFDTNSIKGCDLLLAECSLPSIGLGFEIATALQHNKPVLAIMNQAAKVSKFILGISDHRFSLVSYNSINEIPDAIEKKLEGII